jgi:hypothetical protein
MLSCAILRFVYKVVNVGTNSSAGSPRRKRLSYLAGESLTRTNLGVRKFKHANSHGGATDSGLFQIAKPVSIGL